MPPKKPATPAAKPTPEHSKVLKQEPPTESPFQKIVIFMEPISSLISVQRNDTDPIWLSVPGNDAETALAQALELYRSAQETWSTSPRYQPAPPPPDQPSHGSTPPAAAAPAPADTQSAPRLF